MDTFTMTKAELERWKNTPPSSGMGVGNDTFTICEECKKSTSGTCDEHLPTSED